MFNPPIRLIMEFTGQITSVSEVEHLTTKSGQPFSRRQIIITTVEQYPQSGVFSLSGDTAETFRGQVGQSATVHFNLHTYDSQDGTKTFNKLSAWRVDL